MRAMILAAGLGTRLRPLSDWCAKPAMPIRGIPVIAHTLTLLAKHDVNEVVINLHHLPDSVRDAVERHRPPGLRVVYSEETELLGTGGGIRAVADFLRQSDPSLVLAGDMLVDFDLQAAVRRHRERGDRYTLLLRSNDPRAASFGTLGADDEGCLRRVGRRLDLGGETHLGLFPGIRIVSARGLTDWPPATAFEDLTDWLAPLVRAGARDVRCDAIPAEHFLWEPVGTTEEYWTANLEPPPLSYASEIPGRPAATIVGPGSNGSRRSQRNEEIVILGEGAVVEPGASLQRVVVWPGERVPADVRARDGIWAGGRFVPARA